MKIYECVTILAVVFGNPAVACARQAQVLIFGGSSGAFRTLEPGLRPTDVSEPDVISFGVAPPHLDTILPAGTDEGMMARPTSISDLSIPAWMRGGVSAPMSRLTIPRYGSMQLESCDGVQYAPHPRLSASQELRRRRYFDQMIAAACSAGVPVPLFDALIIQESRYNPLALSAKGATGLTQLMPGTARSLAVIDRWRVSDNLSGGARYLRKQLNTFQSWALALGAYNAGPGDITKFGGLPPFKETREYVRSILRSINILPGSKAPRDNAQLKPHRGLTLLAFDL